MQFCDSTCNYCAREFFKWLKTRLKSQEGRKGQSDFNVAAATSISCFTASTQELSHPSS
jgi:hypothetical protein